LEYEKIKKSIVWMMVAVMLVSLIIDVNSVKATQSCIGGFVTSYELTGDGANDMVAIALAQEGRTGSQIGYTEEWCADFVSDCAILAGQSSAVPQYGGVEGLYNRVIAAGGSVITSGYQPGDLCFIDWDAGSSMGHVEIVYAVSGSTIYTVGGNSGDGSTLYTRCVKKHAPLASKYIVTVVRPAYIDTSTENVVSFDSIAAAEISDNNAKISGWVNSSGSISEIGFYIGMSDTYQNKIVMNSNKVEWTRFFLEYDLSECYGYLTPGVTYRYCFYVINDGIEYRSTTGHFTTSGTNIISYDTYEISSITYNDAKISAWFSNTQGYTLSSIGFLGGENSDSLKKYEVYSNYAWTRHNQVYQMKDYMGALNANTKYVVRFFVTVNGVDYYSDYLQLETQDSPCVGGHTFSGIVTTPTCTEQGYITYTCEVCGENYTADHTNALGHIWDSGTVTKKPTTTETGLKIYICTRCGEDKIEELPVIEEMVVDSGICGTNLIWSLNDSGILTIAGSGSMKNYGYKSEMPWYSYIPQITSVVIENGVTSIGDYAFYGMTSMTQITIPEGVTRVGDYAFKNCTALNGVVLPSTLTYLGESAFYACSALTGITIPEGIYTVWAYTFKNCTGLAEVNLPSTLVKIDEAAFYGCSSLRTLDIPDSVMIIGIYTFKNCSSLNSVSLPSSLTQIREAAFYGTALTGLEVPEGVTKVDAYAFKNCTSLATLNLPSSLTKIGEAAFYGSSVSELTIPDAVSSIGSYAFKNCTSLKSVYLPSSLTKISEASFYNCSSLQTLNLPDKVTSIGNYAFRKCEALRSVKFSSGLTSIGESSFYGCTSLLTLNIPAGVTEIQGYAFKSCTGLEIVELPDSLVTIGESGFYGCTILPEITIPVNVETIGAYAFSRCTGLTGVVFTGDAPAIGAGAFSKVKATVTYPSGNVTWTADVMQNYGGTLNWVTEMSLQLSESSDVLNSAGGLDASEVLSTNESGLEEMEAESSETEKVVTGTESAEETLEVEVITTEVEAEEQTEIEEESSEAETVVTEEFGNNEDLEIETLENLVEDVVETTEESTENLEEVTAELIEEMVTEEFSTENVVEMTTGLADEVMENEVSTEGIVEVATMMEEASEAEIIEDEINTEISTEVLINVEETELYMESLE